MIKEVKAELKGKTLSMIEFKQHLHEKQSLSEDQVEQLTMVCERVSSEPGSVQVDNIKIEF